MIIITVSVICIFNWLYQVSKENIVHIWEFKTEDLSHRVSSYMSLPVDAIAISAQTLNKMLKENKQIEVAQNYLTEETKIYSRLIPENDSGVYAFFKKNYLDGSGWVPDSDYHPKERPWYKAAIKEKGSIVISDPYLNFQTHTLMMSVSQMLSDNESVVSMDIFLDGFQKIIKKITNDGIILAHSNEQMLGNKYFESDSQIKDLVLTTIKNSKKNIKKPQFISEETFIIDNVYENLFLIVNLDEDEVYSSLFLIYIAASVFLLVLILVYFLILIKMSKKYADAERLYKEVQAMYLFVSNN